MDKAKIVLYGCVNTAIILCIAAIIKLWQLNPEIGLFGAALIACILITGTILTYTEPLWKSRL